MRLLDPMHDRVGVLLHLARQRFVDDVFVEVAISETAGSARL